MSDQQPPQWTRKTTWRQGHVLDAQAAASTGIWHPKFPDATCAVVISHDCDLANDDLTVEPDVELIVGRVVPPAEVKGSFAWSKSPRTLHLEFERDGASVIVELVTTSKTLVPKSSLAAFTFDQSFSLDGQGLSVLRNWLSVRYNRAAFPDPFVTRMKKAELDRRLAKLIEPYGWVISAVFFDVDGGQEIDRPEDNPYELSIVLAYDPGHDPIVAMDRAEEAESKVRELFDARCFDSKTGKWRYVELKTCMSISEDDLTVRKAKAFMHWRLEHMSLKVDELSPTPTNWHG